MESRCGCVSGGGARVEVRAVTPPMAEVGRSDPRSAADLLDLQGTEGGYVAIGWL
jgi:hypothetical protein